MLMVAKVTRATGLESFNYGTTNPETVANNNKKRPNSLPRNLNKLLASPPPNWGHFANKKKRENESTVLYKIGTTIV